MRLSRFGYSWSQLWPCSAMEGGTSSAGFASKKSGTISTVLLVVCVVKAGLLECEKRRPFRERRSKALWRWSPCCCAYSRTRGWASDAGSSFR